MTIRRIYAAAQQLDIHLDIAPGSRFACPQCRATDYPAHDTEPETWRHLNFFQHQAYLHARAPRIRCTPIASPDGVLSDEPLGRPHLLLA